MDLNSNILWLIITSIVSIAITYYLTKHPISKYKIIYKKETSCLLSNIEMQRSGISVQHDTCNIDNLYFSKISICNKGYYKITENDFVSNHNIKLFTDGQILPYALRVNDPNDIYKPNDIKINLESSNQIDINIILLQPHTEFHFSFFHTDAVNYSGELKEGKIYEYLNKNYKYPIISSFLIINLLFSFINFNIPEIYSSNILVLKFLFDLSLIVIFGYFYNKPIEQ